MRMRKRDKIKEGYTEASNECNMLILKLGDRSINVYYYSKYRICLILLLHVCVS